MKPPEPPSPEDQRKINRALYILYGAMFALSGLLFLVLWLTTRAK